VKAVIWHAAQDVRIEERPEPEPGPGQILVQMKALGICGSDMKLYEHGVLGTLKPTHPFIMGHEGTGIVARLGPGVKGIQPGDRICINPQIACNQCFYCRRGEQNLCENLSFKSVTGDGVFSEFVLVQTDQAVLLPEHISFEIGTVIEPLSIAVQAVRQTEITPQSKVAIFGAGTIGLMVLCVLCDLGVEKVVVIDIQEHALEKARSLGAAAAIQADQQDRLDAVREVLGARGPDIVFETAGSSITQAQALELARLGGAIVMVGISSQENANVKINRLVRSNLRVFGSVRTSGDAFLTAAKLIISGRVNPGPILNRILPFEETPRAFSLVSDRKHQITKCIIRI
jgi:L-iditol 2-dehydrogenase